MNNFINFKKILMQGLFLIGNLILVVPLNVSAVKNSGEEKTKSVKTKPVCFITKFNSHIAKKDVTSNDSDIEKSLKTATMTNLASSEKRRKETVTEFSQDEIDFSEYSSPKK